MVMKSLFVFLAGFLMGTLNIAWPEEAKPPVTYAIVGLVHDHAHGFIPGAKARKDIQLVAIVEANRDLAGRYAKRYQLNPNLFFGDLETMLKAVKPQAVAVFTSTFDHGRVVETCAAHGVHVMMEKPLAVNLEQARAMERAAHKGDIHVIVNYETTWYPANQSLYALVHEQRQIGDLRKIVVHDGHRGPREIGCSEDFLAWLTDPVLNGGGALTDFGCYGANLITWLMDGQRPQSVFAVTQRIKPDIYPKVDDEATIVVTYPKTQGIIQASWNWPFDRKDMEAYGQSGYVLVPQKDRMRVRAANSSEQEISVPPLTGSRADPLSYLAAVVRGDIQPEGLSSLQVNLVVTEILDAARESAKTGKRVDLNGKLTGSVAPAVATGPLRASWQNPRYFEDGRGKIVYLTGSHTWSNLQDQGAHDPPPVFDFDRYLNFLEQHHHNFIRLWAWEQARWAPWSDGKGPNPSDWFIQPNPYARTGPGLARDGKPKFDLNQFDEAYFQRLRERVRKAGERGIYVSVMLFQGWSSAKGWLGGKPWLGHPYHPENNGEGFNGNLHGDSGPDLNDPRVRERQAAYIRQVVDTINDLDNVLFEVTNEGGNKDWDGWVIRTVHAYEKTKPKQHPVGLTGHGSESNDEMLASPADWVSLGSNDWPDLKTDPRAVDGKKVNLLDTDHVWGVGGDQAWVWKAFLRGHNVLFMDPYDDPQWTPILNGQGVGVRDAEAPRRAMGQTRRYAERIELAQATPHAELASTGFCLAVPLREYLVYLGKEVSVDLSGAEQPFDVEWFDLSTGRTQRGDRVQGGRKMQFISPFTTPDAVLYLKRAQLSE